MSKHPSDLGANDALLPKGLPEARDFVRFLSAHEKEEFLTPLRALLRKHPDIAGAFAWLHVHERRHAEDHASMVLLSALLSPDASRIFTPAQCRRSARAAAGELDKALRDKAVPDVVKATLLPLLHMAGRPVGEDEARPHFKDFDAAMWRFGLEFSRSVSDSPESLTQLLMSKNLVSDDAVAEPIAAEDAMDLFQFGHGIAPTNPAGATVIALALALRVGAPDFSQERGIEILGRIRDLATPRARWCLETLANWPGLAAPFRERAARLAKELAAEGLPSQPPQTPGEFSHGLVSMCDGMGSRTATVFHRTPEGEFDACNVMLNDEVGVKDANAFFRNGSELEEMYRRGSDELSFANASLSHIRELVADSFALHEELGTAPPGNLFALLPYFGNHVVPRRRQPNLGAYMLETHRITPELAAGGDTLASSPVFGTLLFCSDAAYAFCGSHMKKRGSSLPDKAFEAFLLDIVPQERERLLHRMAVNLEVEALAGRAGRPDNQLAARLWLGISENVRPLGEIPYVRELARLSVKHMVDDLRHGHRNQREAFAAEEAESVEDMPEELARMLGLAELSPAEREKMFEGMAELLFGGEEKPRAKKRGRPKKKTEGEN